MQDISPDRAEPEIVAPYRLHGRIVSVHTTADKSPAGFQTQSSETLELDHEGIIGNRHRGWLRPADVRVPYHKRGTPIRNNRHLSAVSAEDMAEAALRLGVTMVDPSWIGANLLVVGFPRFSFMARGTKLFVDGGVVLTVEEQNVPCRIAGRAIAGKTGKEAAELDFPKVARRLRGVLVTVDAPGTIRAGNTLELRVPEQWIYR